MAQCTPKSFDLTGKVALITGASFGMGHPRDVLMCFFHYSITSFPVQMQKGLPHNAVRQSPGSELRSALSVYWGCLPM